MEKIWLQSYPKGIPAEIDIDHIPSLVALFDKACKTYADKVAYISMGREITYRQLDAEASEFADVMRRQAEFFVQFAQRVVE